MGKWKYVAQNHQGQQNTGTLEASSLESLSSLLSAQGLILLEGTPPSSGMNIELTFLERGPGVMDLSNFAEELSTMQGAGINITRSLNQIAENIPNKKFKAVVKDLETQVTQGNRLSEAMEGHPKIFSNLFVSLVRAGETGGGMAEMLHDLAKILKSDAELRTKVKGAMTYPGFTLIVALIITYAMLTTLVPKFASMISELGGKLPPLTAAIMAVSDFLVNGKWFLLVGIIGGSYAFNRWKASPGGKAIWDRTVLKTPIMGKLVAELTLTRITRSYSLLQQGGVRMVDTLEICAGIADNDAYSSALLEVIELVKQGETMADGLNLHPELFPSMVRSMAATGQEAGTLAKLFAHISSYYEGKAHATADALSKAVEPLMIVFVGILIGTVVLGMFMPLFAVINTISSQT